MKASIRNLGIRFLSAGVLLSCLFAGSLQAQLGPTLVSASPANGAINVPLDSKVILTFSAAMQVPSDYSTAITWIDAGGQLVPENFTYSWSPNAKALTCTYSSPLPAATSITWFLDTTSFLDLAGNELSFMPFPFGIFTTTSGGGSTNNCTDTSGAGSLTSYSLFKSATYVQNSTGPSTPDSASDPFSFIASVSLATNRTATAVTLTVPGGSPEPMSSFFGSPYLLVESTNDLSKLDALFPAGSYTFAVTGTPNQTVTANLPANTLPNAPHLSNYTAAQTINAGANFTLTWDPFIGGPPEEAISVEILDSLQRVVFELTNAAGCPRLLLGTDTSVIVPGGTLSSNQTYTLRLMFVKNATFDTNSHPGSVVVVGGSSTTDITISTSSGGVVPPSMVLTNVAMLPGGQFQFLFGTAPGTAYTVEYTSDLSDPLGWTSFPVTNAVGATILFTDTPPSGTPQRFYRTKRN